MLDENVQIVQCEVQNIKGEYSEANSCILDLTFLALPDWKNGSMTGKHLRPSLVWDPNFPRLCQQDQQRKLQALDNMRG